MVIVTGYNRNRAYRYARKWALERNPIFENYSGIGGDCTNFVSQCIYAACCQMNFTPTFGWYYNSPTDRAAAWTGVEYFYNFIVNNTGLGPFGRVITDFRELKIGDVIQLAKNDGGYYHSLIVTGFAGLGGYIPLVSAHSDDVFDRRLTTYNYDYSRYIHIDGIRIDTDTIENCFEYMMSGGQISADSAN